MDKEIRGKTGYIKNPMRQRIIEWLVKYDTAFQKGTLPSVSETVDQIIALVLPKDKPPLLSDKEAIKALRDEPAFNCRYDTGIMRATKAVAQAKRETDIKHYEH